MKLRFYIPSLTAAWNHERWRLIDDLYVRQCRYQFYEKWNRQVEVDENICIVRLLLKHKDFVVGETCPHNKVLHLWLNFYYFCCCRRRRRRHYHRMESIAWYSVTIKRVQLLNHQKIGQNLRVPLIPHLSSSLWHDTGANEWILDRHNNQSGDVPPIAVELFWKPSEYLRRSQFFHHLPPEMNYLQFQLLCMNWLQHPSALFHIGDFFFHWFIIHFQSRGIAKGTNTVRGQLTVVNK